MPKKSKKAASATPLKQVKQTTPAPELPDSGASNPSADWLEKNAHAKAIIMSTLIPGSEPWKIAEPLEYAADIWKALEDRYAPKNDSAGNRLERADFVNDWVEGKDMNKYKDGPRQGAMLTDFPADALNPEMSNRLINDKLDAALKDSTAQSKFIQEITKMEQEKQASKERRKREANEAAAKVMVEHMPNRDQRFLWALLHGGKEETMNWFNGITTTTKNT